ncbi:MAG: hypothetical protein INR73_22085 [Williamsia sp.]|nr:hypothetical protein [Williamsia sp.]
MTKFLVSLVLIMLLSFAACLYLPWWSIALVACIIAILIPQKPLPSFTTGFLALFILWSAFALLVSIGNHHLLAQKMSVVMFKAANPFLLVFVSGLIGALVAGFAALTGSYARKLPRRETVR